MTNMASNRDFDSVDEWESSVTDSDSEALLITSRPRKRLAPVPSPVPPKRTRHKVTVQLTSSSSGSSGSPPRGSDLQTSQGIPRQAPSSRVRRGNQGISAGEIYEAILSGKSATVTIVDEWLDSYKQDPEAGLLVFVNFIVQCCGCKGVVTREMFEKMQNPEIISILTKEFKEESVNYPLSSPGPQWKRFRTGLFELVKVLVHSCQNSLLYDEYLFNNLLALLTGLSDSQVRAFRHTSTLLAMKLMTWVVEVGVMVNTQLLTNQRQYSTESSKMDQDRSTARLEELQALIKELLEHREELKSLINGTFSGVFVHRYRDLVPAIRAVCIQELGLWLKGDPETFLNDGYLKYLGWTLHDKHGAVRLHCVRALQGLYQEKNFHGRLELFTCRFKERMLSMVFDKEPDVAMEVVHLLLVIQLYSEESLSDEECAHVYSVVFTSHRGLASAAGLFLYKKVKSVISNGEPGTEMVAFFSILITFFLESECNDHAAYLVDSLWSVAVSELRAWEIMTSLLLQECEEAQFLSYDEEGALLEIMMCAIRQAAEANPPVGRAHGKRMTLKDKKTQDQDRKRITSHFIPLLPQLLTKYSADAEKVTLLLKAPLYFDLEIYSSTMKFEKHLDLLLNQVCSIVGKHSEADVLEACAHLAWALCSDTHTFSTRANLAFSQLVDGLAECFSSYLDDILQGTADEDDLYSAATALKRIAAFSSARDLTDCQLFESCLQLLKSGVESRELDKELMVPALTCAAFQLLWDKATASSSTPDEAELRRLKKALRSFCGVSEKCLTSCQAEIREQAFVLLCDLLLVYSVGSVRSQASLHTLAHPPSDTLCSEMAAFLLDYIFTEPEDNDPDEDDEAEQKAKIATLQRKRNLLAGYCKLIIYGVMDLSAATDVFKHYNKYYKDFGDIIKMTLSKSRLISPVQSAKTVCLCLQQFFSEMISTDGSGQELGEIRALAKRLAMSFGVNLIGVRKPLMSLHTDGIRFAFQDPEEGRTQPPNLPFLEILSEFSFKLIRQDRTQLAAFLKKECPTAVLCWPSVRMYQRSLEGGPAAKPRRGKEGDKEEKEVGGGGEDTSSSVSLHNTSGAKRRRTDLQEMKEFEHLAMKRPWTDIDMQHSSLSSTSGEVWLDGSSSIHSNLLNLVLTSTVVGGLGRTHPPATGSEEGSVFSPPLSEDEFSTGYQVHKVRSTRGRQASSSLPSPDPHRQDLRVNLSLMSLTDEDPCEDTDEEPEIEDFHSEESSDYTLPSTRHTSTSALDELFN